VINPLATLGTKARGASPWGVVGNSAPQPACLERAGAATTRQHPVGIASGNSSGWCQASLASQSLNADPYNVCAESLALTECTLGVEVRRTWSEMEMVRSFGGQMSPGTPDGMFESWDGALTCVQVVRVPLVAGLPVVAMQDTLAQTVLAKVVKSQRWLAFTQASPADFVIFCWLPFAVPDAVVEHAEKLMLRIRGLDPRFSLRLRTPEEPSALFPALFACNRERCDCSVRASLSEADVSTYPGSEPDSGEEEEWPAWDITWAWEINEPTWSQDSEAEFGCSSDPETTDGDGQHECEGADIQLAGQGLAFDDNG